MAHTTLPMRIAAAGSLGFVGAAATAGFLTHGYDAAGEPLGALTAPGSRHAWLMVTGYACAAVSLVASAAALRSRAGLVLATGLSGLVAVAVLVEEPPLVDRGYGLAERLLVLLLLDWPLAVALTHHRTTNNEKKENHHA